MSAFAIKQDQVVRIAAALIADELFVSFGRHVDAITVSSWSGETLLRDAGVGLTEQELETCAARLQRFFGDAAISRSSNSLADWAAAITLSAGNRLATFTFSAAGGERRETKHSADSMFADAASVANLLYGRRRVLSLVAPHGLIGFILSTLTPNLLLAPAIDVRRLTPEALTTSLLFGDALIATPSLWRYLISQGVTAPDNAMAISFGEAMTPELSADVRRMGFGAQREIYGSTETGLVGWRDAPNEPFTLFDQWRRDGTALCRLTPAGKEMPVAPMDMLIWEGERRFHLAGRCDGAVQVGAVNVFPEAIARRIAEHPLVEGCVVSVSQHNDAGNRLMATIALKSGGAPGESAARAIDNWCRAKLRPYERPRVYNYSAAVK